MSFLQPEFLLFALPVGFVLARTRPRNRVLLALRIAVAALLVAALAAPYLPLSDPGRDLVVVLDRSRSMPAEGETTTLELLKLAQEAQRSGDRIAVVTFGADAAIERLPTGELLFEAFEAAVDADGTDLGDALETALNLIPESRQGSILVVSDGENNGRDALHEVRRAFARGVRVDVRPVLRPPIADLSVDRIDLPDEVLLGEPFQFSAWVRADRAGEAEFVLRRGDVVLARGRRAFEPGANRMLFRDVAAQAGIAEYTLELSGTNDRVPENDRGLAAALVRGTRPVLVLNHDGAEDTLVRALVRSGVPALARRPEDVRLDTVGLSRWRAVVLENVSAQRVGREGLGALREFVVERGGGLLMTGGKASFGVGGYHLTPIDEILPVSMELRQEHRKQGVAMVFVLDRSGSMGAPAGGGTKMDLANEGTASAIALLSSIDSVGVLAVDQKPHVVQKLTPVMAPEPLQARVRTIESQGGGIYVRTGLLAAGKMLEEAEQVNRHIVLFADAADAEEPQDVPAIVQRLGQMGTTVSVIALGADTDSDAEFLRSIAREGGGEIYFSNDPSELPTLFSQDALTVARSSFLERETTVRLLPDLFSLGELLEDGFPALEGYNLNYLRPGALAGAVSVDEYAAPVLAFWHQGIGRTASYAGQIGGSFGARVVAWPGFSSFFVTLSRWLAGQEEPQDFFPSVRRVGTEAIVSVEVDPEAPIPPNTSALEARIQSPGGGFEDVLLQRAGDDRFEARLPLTSEGVSVGTLRLDDGRFVTLPPVALPYSPEFERSTDLRRGERLLERIARESGGEVVPAAHRLFRGPRAAKAFRVISRELMLAALVLLLIEIGGRRLDLFASLRLPRRLGAWLRRRGRAGGDEAAQVAARRGFVVGEDVASPGKAPSEPGRTGDDDPYEAARRRARQRTQR